MDVFLRAVRRVASAVMNLLRRFLDNNARNDFEQMVFESFRALIVEYGRVA